MEKKLKHLGGLMVKCQNKGCGKQIKGAIAYICGKAYCQDCYYKLRKSRRPKPSDLSRYSYRLENID